MSHLLHGQQTQPPESVDMKCATTHIKAATTKSQAVYAEKGEYITEKCEI